MPAALLTDFRTKAPWVAGYLRCVLRTDGGGNRSAALDEVLAMLDIRELRELSRRAEEVAETRGYGRSCDRPDQGPAHCRIDTDRRTPPSARSSTVLPYNATLDALERNRVEPPSTGTTSMHEAERLLTATTSPGSAAAEGLPCERG
jgi:hypothetical protein